MSYLVNNTPVIDGNTQTGLANVSILGANGYLFVGPSFQGVAGYTSGGAPSLTATIIDKFPFSTDANASYVGNLTQGRARIAGQSSNVSGYTSGGYSPSVSNRIDKFPFASNASAVDVADLTVARYSVAGQSSTVSGYTSGGRGNVTPAYTNIIDKFPFSTDANATDVGDLTINNISGVGQSSTVSGYTSGGQPNGSPVAGNTIDKFPFSTNANASDVGDLTVARYNPAGQSSTASGYTSGGFTTGPVATVYNVIDKFPFASDANATDVGDLTGVRQSVAGQSSITSGYTSGGYGLPSPGASSNVIDKFPFASNANATDVGDLSVARDSSAGQQQ